jgi:hypothetical protein
MVKFGFEDWSNIDMPGSKPPIHLIIYTNEITKEILESVDTEKTPNIIFQIPSSEYLVFDLQANVHEWKRFARYIENLSFRGTLVEKQFTVQHFEGMNHLKQLAIGATSYPLFEGEDISKLPVIRRFIGNGYGLVQTSESLDKWLRKIKLNSEAIGSRKADYYLY